MAWHSRRWLVISIPVLLVAAAIVILVVGGSRLDGVVLLPANTNLNPKRSVVALWFQRAKEFVFGKSRTVLVDVTFVSVSASASPPLSFPRVAKTITNLHVYLVGTNEASKMYKHLTIGESASTQCRIVTSHGIYTKIAIPSSLTLELVARERSHGTDLLTSIGALGAGTANLTARLQIPKDHAVFILKTTDPPDMARTRAVVLTPRWK